MWLTLNYYILCISLLSWQLSCELIVNKDGRAVLTFSDLEKVPLADGYSFGTIISIVEDELNPGAYLFGTLSNVALLTANKTIHMVAGQENNSGFQNGNLTESLFTTVQDITHYNSPYELIVMDSNNHCVRRINRLTNRVTTFAGKCEESGNVTSSLSASATRMEHPTKLLYIKEERIFYYLLRQSILKHDIKTDRITLMYKSADDSFRLANSFVITRDLTYLYVAHVGGVWRFSTDSWETRLIVSADTAQAYLSGLAWLIPDQILLLAYNDENELAVTNLAEGSVYPICRAANDSEKYVLDGKGSCKYLTSTMLSVLSGDTIIMGYRAEDMRGFLLQLKYSQPVCMVTEYTDNGWIIPYQAEYYHLETVLVSCKSGYRLNTKYSSVRCEAKYYVNDTVYGQWDKPVPECKKEVILSQVTPIQGQQSGGTEITLRGQFVSSVRVSVIYDGVSTTANITMHNQTHVQFFMPARPFISKDSFSNETQLPVNAVMEIVFDDNSFLTEFTRNYTYLPNPAVETVSRCGSILSGGLLMTFTGRNLESAHFYKLELYFGIETLAVDTECFKEIVGHSTHVVCVTPNVAAEYTRFVHKSNSSDQDTFLLTASLLGDGAPALVSGVERFNYTVSTSLPYFIRVKTAISYDVRQEEPINFIGKHLKQSLHPSDYQISFVTDLSTSQSSAIQCVVAELTDTLLTCLPEKLKLLQTFNESGAVTVEAQIKVGNLLYEDITRLNLHNSDDTSTNPVPPSNYWVIALAAVLALLAVTAMIVVFLKFFECRKKSKPTEISSYTMDPVKDKYYKTVGEDLNEELKHKLNQMFIEPEMLSFNRSTDLLGKGAYGKVYLGQLQCQGNTLKSVAVKTLKESVDANSEQIEAFLEEATFLQLHEHANILVTLGVVWRSGEKPLVVLPYMANGDLCSLIRRPEITFSNGDLMHFGMQISAGMEYLITQHCLHRDLAARNCLVDNFYIVKIADFGMSKDVYRESYYREKDQDKPRPVKWMALESLREGVSNSATEVWAFGVVMWELLTRGNVPYPGISNSEMLNHLQSGHRLHKPTYTCPKVFDVIKECWNEDPLERPSFSQLKEFLEHSLSILDEPPLQKLGDGLCYSYARHITKDIPDDYSSSGVFSSSTITDVIYIDNDLLSTDVEDNDGDSIGDSCSIEGNMTTMSIPDTNSISYL